MLNQHFLTPLGEHCKPLMFPTPFLYDLVYFIVLDIVSIARLVSLDTRVTFVIVYIENFPIARNSRLVENNRYRVTRDISMLLNNTVTRLFRFDANQRTKTLYRDIQSDSCIVSDCDFSSFFKQTILQPSFTEQRTPRLILKIISLPFLIQENTIGYISSRSDVDSKN